jgi:hypothetical protein
MTDLIIRSPYPAGDKLYPLGWRSYEIVIKSKNSFEVISEIISLNNMKDPNQVEMVSINDITSQIIRKIVSKNILELANVIISLNNMKDAYSSEIISINILASEILPEIISVNDIQEFEGPYFNEVIGLNRLESLDSVYPVTEISYNLTITIDNINVTDSIISCEIEIDGESFVNSCSLAFADNTYFTQCSVLKRRGEERIIITIDDIQYKFLLEKRSFSSDSNMKQFSVWGRSIICTLGAPYASTINDKVIVQDQDTLEWSCPEDETYVPHIWQTSDRMASQIIENLIGSDFTLQMDIDDFVIKKDNFTVNNETPIEIINRLISPVSQIRTNLNGDVIIRYKRFNTLGDPVSAYTDLENLFLINENVVNPEGYNSILIRGPQDPLTDQSVGLQVELDDDLNNQASTFKFGDYIWIRVYRSPFNLNYDISTSLGSIFLINENVLEVISDEKTDIQESALKTNKPIRTISSIDKYDCSEFEFSEIEFKYGYKVINILSGTYNEPVEISYTSYYDLYRLVVNQPCDPLTFSEVISRVIVEET